jgi:hypothetical protein
MADVEAQCRLLQLPFIVKVLFDSVVMRAIIGKQITKVTCVTAGPTDRL